MDTSIITTVAVFSTPLFLRAPTAAAGEGAIGEGSIFPEESPVGREDLHPARIRIDNRGEVSNYQVAINHTSPKGLRAGAPNLRARPIRPRPRHSR